MNCRSSLVDAFLGGINCALQACHKVAYCAPNGVADAYRRIRLSGESLLPWPFGEVARPQYVIEREIPGAGGLSDAELHEVARKSLGVLRAMGP